VLNREVNPQVHLHNRAAFPMQRYTRIVERSESPVKSARSSSSVSQMELCKLCGMMILQNCHQLTRWVQTEDEQH